LYESDALKTDEFVDLLTIIEELVMSHSASHIIVGGDLMLILTEKELTPHCWALSVIILVYYQFFVTHCAPLITHIILI